MVRHSEDWWGVLRQGIESEHKGLVRHDVVVLGGARPALVSLGMEIELENIGPARLGMDSNGKLLCARAVLATVG